MRGKTFYIKKSECDLSKQDLPSAGPRPSIKGMRNLYWGDCDIAKQGDYIYKLNTRAGLPWNIF